MCPTRNAWICPPSTVRVSAKSAVKSSTLFSKNVIFNKQICINKLINIGSDSGEESDPETTEWENQQIRKGVTGAQLVSAQQDSIYGSYIMKSNEKSKEHKSTGNLLEQAYARSSLEKARQMMNTQKRPSAKPTGPRTPQEVQQKLRTRLEQVQQLHNKHADEIDQMDDRLRDLKVTETENAENAPVAAIKYRFYQELRGYVTDLVECLDEKVNNLFKHHRQIIVNVWFE